MQRPSGSALRTFVLNINVISSPTLEDEDDDEAEAEKRREERRYSATRYRRLVADYYARYGIVNGPCGRTATREFSPARSNRSLTAWAMSWQGVSLAATIFSSAKPL